MKDLNNFAAAALAILVPTLTLGFPASAQEPTNPVGFALSCTIPAGQTTCTAQVSPPAGKRVVIETVPARVTVPSGQVGQLYVSMSVGNLPNGTIAARHYIVLTPATDTTYFANEAFRMYGSVAVTCPSNDRSNTRSISAAICCYHESGPGRFYHRLASRSSRPVVGIGAGVAQW